MLPEGRVREVAAADVRGGDLIKEVGLELDAVLVERDGVPEGIERGVAFCEGDVPGDNPNGVNCVPTESILSALIVEGEGGSYQTPRNSMSTSIENDFFCGPV